MSLKILEFHGFVGLHCLLFGFNVYEDVIFHAVVGSTSLSGFVRVLC